MVRASLLLRPPREPVEPRAAATLLLLRDGPAGLEVLMTRRSAQASFMPNAFVFPGGGIDAQDAAAHPLATRRPTQHDALLTATLAAIRESFEELGVLLARDAQGRLVGDAEVAALDRRAPFFEQVAARGLVLAAADVYYLARWITNHGAPKRFDVPFLVARMPEGQVPVADESEQFEPLWLTPAEALARGGAREMLLPFPTRRTLEWLQAHPHAQSVLAACGSEQPLWTSCPRSGQRAGQRVRVTEQETPYGELALVHPDGMSEDHPLDWQHEVPVPLARHLARLTAPNAGMMTGPGTNTYLVGDADCGWIVIDPGPDDPAHVARLVQATGGDVRAIVCTHSHADHAPGARPLQALCAGRPPVLGLPSGPGASPASRFTPDRALADGERLVLQGAGHTHTLRVIHTPGHAANHLCLVLEEDGLLFSGDHILNGSTTVVAPPDGDMTHYLDSLDRLSDQCEAHGIRFILPAHGHVLGEAAAAIARLKAHRLAREAKVLAAMQAQPAGGLDDWLPAVYGDVPAGLWPVARLSLQAHVDRLRALGH